MFGALVVSWALLGQVAPIEEAPHEARPALTFEEARPAAIEWMLSRRIMFDALTPRQIDRLRARYAQLTPSELRTLVMVYERTYGMEPPPEATLPPPEDDALAAREWLLAYRIVTDRLTVQQAARFAGELAAARPDQLQIMRSAYSELEELARAGDRRALGYRYDTAHPIPPSVDEEEQRRRRFAAERMAFEMQRREAALNNAAMFRGADDLTLQLMQHRGPQVHAMVEQLRWLRAFSDLNYGQNLYRNFASDRWWW